VRRRDLTTLPVGERCVMFCGVEPEFRMTWVTRTTHHVEYRCRAHLMLFIGTAADHPEIVDLAVTQLDRTGAYSVAPELAQSADPDDRPGYPAAQEWGADC
jgi:hypothetical protein